MNKIINDTSRVFVLSIAVAALASPAYAQTAAQSNADGVGDIIVTAQKRAENVQDVPIAITAVDSARLENTAASLNTTNLQQFVPGLVQGRAGAAGATFLRGVGSEAGIAGTESPVATYLDGIYLGVNALGVFELNNIDQISVLKGPQGTLFGRNATGGAIQITTKNPNLDSAEVRAEIGYGNYETKTTRFYGSVPITSNLAANVSLLYKDRDKGTVFNRFTGNDLQAENIFTAQGKILWQPTDDTRVLLNVIHTNGKDLPGVNYFVQKGAVSQDGRTRYIGPRTIDAHVDSDFSAKATIGALTVSHDFGGAQLSNTVSRTIYKNRSFNDQSMTTGAPNPGGITPSSGNLDTEIREVSNELQLQSADEAALKWVAGLFYFHDKTDTSLRTHTYPAGVPVPGSYGLNSRMKTDSYSGYGQATYEVLPSTNLTGGIRYTRDDKSFSGRLISGFTVPASVPRDISFKKLTWRLAVDHQFNDDLMAYASYNRGFRAGTYSPLSLANPPARPETLDAYEVGFKSDLFDRKLRLNTAAFYYNYADLQLRKNVGSPLQGQTLNAAKAKIYGLDVDIEARPSRDLRIMGGFEILKSEYSSFPSGPANFPVGVAQLGMNPITAPPAGCTGTVRAGFGHSNTVSCDLTGNDLINAPRFSASIGVEYTLPTSIGDFAFSVGDKYTGKSYATPDNFQILEAYHYVTASVSWTSTDGHFFGKIWGTNLTQPDRPAQLAFGLNTYEFLPSEPRFYGITLGFKY